MQKSQKCNPVPPDKLPKKSYPIPNIQHSKFRIEITQHVSKNWLSIFYARGRNRYLLYEKVGILILALLIAIVLIWLGV